MTNQALEHLIQIAGVVGAGGAGFPAHAKIRQSAEVIIANGAECEPLLRVDQQVMEHFADDIVGGLAQIMAATNASRGVIGLKAKYAAAITRLEAAIARQSAAIQVHLVDNYYPAGDEQMMVYDITGKVVPVGGLPLDVGAIVFNVTTLMNIKGAIEGNPVTHKFVTVGGEVKNPQTFNAPIGMSLRSLIRAAGGPEDSDRYTLVLGGPNMGKLEFNWDAPITKTLGGILVLPSDHLVVQKKITPLEKQIQMSRAICCQCNYCSELCPRNALGLSTSPHKAMRSLAYGQGDSLSVSNIISCCDCGICTYYACPMGLLPSRIMTSLKGQMLQQKLPIEKKVPFRVDPAREFKRIPIKRLIDRLGIAQYDLPAPIALDPLTTSDVMIPLKQHIGAPCQPIVKVGDPVTVGQLIGEVPAGQLGACIHASITGIVVSVDSSGIRIQA